MKKYLVVMAAIAIVIVMAGASMAATTSSSVAATATIANKCVAGGSPALAFGSLDGSMVGPYPATVTNPTLFCTSGDTITVTDDGGLSGTTGGGTGTSWNLKSGANLIPYTLTYTTSLTGAGFSTDLGGSGAGKLSLSASIANGAIATAPAGSYTDTVVITYTY
jgi:spore coat protein U-like protein